MVPPTPSGYCASARRERPVVMTDELDKAVQAFFALLLAPVLMVLAGEQIISAGVKSFLGWLLVASWWLPGGFQYCFVFVWALLVQIKAVSSAVG
jgi:hypothetical protein